MTFNKGMTKFGDFIIFECERRGLQNIHFIGLKSKEKLDDIYRNETDALIFLLSLKHGVFLFLKQKSLNYQFFLPIYPMLMRQ